MKTAIVYTSRHGTTEKIAQLISSKLADRPVTLIDLRISPDEQLDEFDRILLGGSIHMGKIQGKVKKFYTENMDLLLQKELGLFMCGMAEDQLQEEFENAFPEMLRNHSKANGLFGGEFLFERMNFFEKLVVKNVAKVRESVSKINYPAIEQFIQLLEGKSVGVAGK